MTPPTATSAAREARTSARYGVVFQMSQDLSCLFKEVALISCVTGFLPIWGPVGVLSRPFRPDVTTGAMGTRRKPTSSWLNLTTFIGFLDLRPESKPNI